MVFFSGICRIDMGHGPKKNIWMGATRTHQGSNLQVATPTN